MTDDAASASPAPAPVPADRGPGGEKRMERAIFLRFFVYVFATHLFAGFVWLLFYIGGRRM